ncbi:MAG: hypothetical protein ACRDJG_03025, partial [Actinomycetota bacterium]
MRDKVREEQAETRRTAPDPAQRRFDRIFALVFVAVMAALVTILGVILPRLREGDQPPANGKQNREAEVERAYLAYWDALEEAYLKLNISPLEKVATAGVLEVERKVIDRERQEGSPRREVVTQHDYRIVVYREGDVVSVDDVYELKRVHLDPQTLEPAEE